MRIDNGVAHDMKIAYIGGGSRGWAWGLMADLALQKKITGEVVLYDVDALAAEANERIGNRHTADPRARSAWVYRAVESLEEALRDADFVVISILPGTLDQMEVDVETPKRWGVYQSVGDTTGPGGIIRALRTIPIYRQFAEQIRKHCPDAWVINYTNPMTVCVRTLTAVFPQIKVIGCCHEVFGTQNLLVRMIRDELGHDGVDRRELRTNVIGINHFTWFTAATWRHIDLMPIYQRFARKHAESGFSWEPDRPTWQDNVFSSGSRVKFDLALRYGAIAAAGDRHLAEFCPPRYLKDPSSVEHWQFHLTPISWRRQEAQRRAEVAAEMLETELPMKPSGEEGVAQMTALAGLGDMTTNVNVPNCGQISNLPPGAVVETNASIVGDSVIPITAGALPNPLAGAVAHHVARQEALVTAGLCGDAQSAFPVFADDPLCSQLSLNDAYKLFDEMFGFAGVACTVQDHNMVY